MRTMDEKVAEMRCSGDKDGGPCEDFSNVELFLEADAYNVFMTCNHCGNIYYGFFEAVNHVGD